MTKQGIGSLLFSKKQPEITGYLTIDGEEFEIVGWRPSPTRAEIKVTQIDPGDGYDGSGSGARKCDIA